MPGPLRRDEPRLLISSCGNSFGRKSQTTSKASPFSVISQPRWKRAVPVERILSLNSQTRDGHIRHRMILQGKAHVERRSMSRARPISKRPERARQREWRWQSNRPMSDAWRAGYRRMDDHARSGLEVARCPNNSPSSRALPACFDWPRECRRRYRAHPSSARARSGKASATC